MNPNDPLNIRSQFPVVNEATYLAAASICPSPLSATQAGLDFVKSKGSLPYELDDMLDQTTILRGKVAQLINASTHEIGLIYTTSEAENLIMRALDLQPGDNIVTDDLHYSASYVIYEQLAKLGVEIKIARRDAEGRVSAETLAPLFDKNTRLLSVAWVSHQTGHRHDLAALADLAHANGSYFYADIIQGLGHLPLDVKAIDIDFCAAGSYKWTLGSFGVASLYIKESLLEMVTPDRFGSFHILSKTGEFTHELPVDGRKFMYATPAFGPVYQLSAGLDFVQSVGVENIEKHVVGLAHYYRAELVKLGYQPLTPENNQSAITAFVHGLDVDRLKDGLSAENIHVNFREGDSQIRIGAALFNIQSEIDAFISVLRSCG